MSLPRQAVECRRVVWFQFNRTTATTEATQVSGEVHPCWTNSLDFSRNPFSLQSEGGKKLPFEKEIGRSEIPADQTKGKFL